MKIVPATQEFKIKKTLSYAKKLSTQGHFTEAIDIYNSILQQQPHNTAAKKNLSKLKKKILSNTNTIQSHSDPSQQQINALTGLYRSGRMQEAENAARNLISTYPNNLLLRNIYGATLMELDKSQEALSVFKIANALKPADALTHGNLGSVLHRLGRLEEALENYNKAIELKPDHPMYHLNRGNVLADLGQQNKALKNFEKALQLNPDYIEAYYGYGNALNDLEQLEESLANYDKCINLKPEFLEAHVGRGGTLKKLGRLEEAIISYQKAIQLNPEKAEASICLGIILARQGKFKEAVKLVQIHLDKDPKNIAAMTLLIGALNYCSPEAAVGGDHAKVQEKLRQIVPDSIDIPIITNETVQKLYQQCYSEMAFSGLSDYKYAQSQIWRGKEHYLGCERHFVVFNNFNAIPRYCFSCYKIYVEPRTVLELFKLMIVFDTIKLPNDKARKCMVETRPEISGAYKGYIYCQGHDEGLEILRRVQEVVAERISKYVKVTLKRGCSEFALSYPEYIKNDENGKSVMAYKDEWGEHEDYADKNLVKHIYPPVLDSHNHAGLTLHDALVMHNWLAYAATIGDLSYMEISGAPVEKLRIDKRPRFTSVEG